jgi:hypothetical protein
MAGIQQYLDWEKRLATEVEKLRTSVGYRELTLNRLKELVRPPSEQALVLELLGFVSEGEIIVGYRVISPKTHESLGTFPNPFEIPEQMIDQSTGEEIYIDRFNDVEAVYANEARFAR